LRSESQNPEDSVSRTTRAIHELLGLLRKITADHYSSETESEALSLWIHSHQQVMDRWPVSVIAKRLKRIYADKQADEGERADLEVLIERILEQAQDEAFLFGGDTVPLTKPAPVVVFSESEFVLAGRFLYGSRHVCEQEVMARGGRCVEDVHHDTDYVVVGGLIVKDWKSSPVRHKILKAVEYQKLSPVHIISEEHWESYLWRESPAARPDKRLVFNLLVPITSRLL